MLSACNNRKVLHQADNDIFNTNSKVTIFEDNTLSFQFGSNNRQVQLEDLFIASFIYTDFGRITLRNFYFTIVLIHAQDIAQYWLDEMSVNKTINSDFSLFILFDDGAIGYATIFEINQDFFRHFRNEIIHDFYITENMLGFETLQRQMFNYLWYTPSYFIHLWTWTAFLHLNEWIGNPRVVLRTITFETGGAFEFLPEVVNIQLANNRESGHFPSSPYIAWWLVTSKPNYDFIGWYHNGYVFETPIFSDMTFDFTQEIVFTAIWIAQ